jgi:hypothetical protein
MIQECKIKMNPKPPIIIIIVNELHDSAETKNEIDIVFKKSSSSFLRRHTHRHHENLYLKRKVDSKIINLYNNLKPSILKKQKLNKKNSSKQYCIIRDFSGTGKNYA